MRTQILGMEFTSGVSKKTGQPYAMAKVHYQAQSESVDFDSYQNVVIGLVGIARNLEVTNIEHLEALKRKFSKVNFPCLGTLVTEERQRLGKFESALIDVIIEEK